MANFFAYFNLKIFEEKNPLLISSEWEETTDGKWAKTATVKIFSNENSFLSFIDPEGKIKKENEEISPMQRRKTISNMMSTLKFK